MNGQVTDEQVTAAYRELGAVAYRINSTLNRLDSLYERRRALFAFLRDDAGEPQVKVGKAAGVSSMAVKLACPKPEVEVDVG